MVLDASVVVGGNVVGCVGADGVVRCGVWGSGRVVSASAAPRVLLHRDVFVLWRRQRGEEREPLRARRLHFFKGEEAHARRRRGLAACLARKRAGQNDLRTQRR
eukprot:5715465-Pleurochrysis_carterae.AAC.1